MVGVPEKAIVCTRAFFVLAIVTFVVAYFELARRNKMAKQTSRITVVDSSTGKTLKHSIYSIVYLPSWLRIRYTFKWSKTEEVFRSTSTMREYFTAAPFKERPFRAQRCLFVIRSLYLYSYKRNGLPRFSIVSIELLTKLMKELTEYLNNNPVVAWDWIAAWSESQALAEAYPDELVKIFRRLRSHRDSKRKPKTELSYFIGILEAVARDHNIDLEYK